MAVLVTGGLGYIGSHTVIELINNGYEVIIVDNLVNSKMEVLNRLKKITGVTPKFYLQDVCDKSGLKEIFKKEKIEAVIHFAGLKAVGESVSVPLKYYRNNIDSTLTLLEVMNEFNVNKIVFSSSATVYGTPKKVPITEKMPVGNTTNPYGTTKLFIEHILQDTHEANKDLSVVILRYFNPIGAHESGLIGEDPNGIPNNLMPYISQVAINKLPSLGVYGNDYKTIDGTGVRDYIHVVDLATGHIAALKKLEKKDGLFIYNLGTGKGTSVMELIKAFEEANNIKIPYKVLQRRPGDIDESYANCKKAEKELHWKAKKDINQGCKDTWRWQSTNPKGFE